MFRCLLLFICISSFAQERVYIALDSSQLAQERLTNLKASPQLDWWSELGTELLICLPSQEEDQLLIQDLVVRKFVVKDSDELFLSSVPVQHGYHILAQNGRLAIVLQRPHHRPIKHKVNHPHAHGAFVSPFQPNRQYARYSKKTTVTKNAIIEAMLTEINPTRWYFDMYELHCFNRYTFGDEIGIARQWLINRFSEIEGISLSTQEFDAFSSTGTNVIATMTGTLEPEKMIIIGAHLDATSQIPTELAPGCEDNASGTAALLELARVFAKNPPPQTLVFIAYDAEELGSIGSQAHVDELKARNELSNIQAVLTMDMIAYTAGQNRVILETSEAFTDLMNTQALAAETYTNLNMILSTNPFGSDHIPYLQESIPTTLTIEADYASYPGYHRTNDIIDHLEPDLGHEVLKMNVATVATLMGMGESEAEHTKK